MKRYKAIVEGVEKFFNVTPDRYDDFIAAYPDAVLVEGPETQESSEAKTEILTSIDNPSFLPDAAESADVVSKDVAQNVTGLPLEDGSLELESQTEKFSIDKKIVTKEEYNAYSKAQKEKDLTGETVISPPYIEDLIERNTIATKIKNIDSSLEDFLFSATDKGIEAIEKRNYLQNQLDFSVNEKLFSVYEMPKGEAKNNAFLSLSKDQQKTLNAVVEISKDTGAKSGADGNTVNEEFDGIIDPITGLIKDLGRVKEIPTETYNFDKEVFGLVASRIVDDNVTKGRANFNTLAFDAKEKIITEARSEAFNNITKKNKNIAENLIKKDTELQKQLVDYTNKLTDENNIIKGNTADDKFTKAQVEALNINIGLINQSVKEYNIKQENLKKEFKNIQDNQDTLAGTYKISKTTGEIQDTFRKTQEIKDFKKEASAGLDGYAQGINSLTQGVTQVFLEGSIGWTSFLLGKTASIFQDVLSGDESYNQYDAFVDLIDNNIGYDVLGVEASKAFTPGRTTTGADFAALAGDIIPFSFYLINQAKKGKVSSIENAIGKISKRKPVKDVLSGADKDMITAAATVRALALGNYTDALDQGLSKSEAFAYSSALTIGTMGVQTIMPDYKFIKGATGKKLKDALSKLPFKDKGLGTNAAAKAGYEAAKQLGGGVVKEFGEEELEFVFQRSLNTSFALANSEFLSDEWYKEQKQLIAGVGMLSTGLGSIGSYKTATTLYAETIRTNQNKINNLKFELYTTKNALEKAKANGENIPQQSIDEVQGAIDYATRLDVAITKSPNNVTGQELAMLVEKSTLLDEKKNLDSSFHGSIDERIAEIDKEIEESRSTTFIKDALEKDIEFSEKLNKDLDFKGEIKTFDNSEELNSFQESIKNDIDGVAESTTGFGTIINLKDGSDIILINKGEAFAKGRINTTAHELLHRYLRKLLKDNEYDIKSVGSELNAYYESLGLKSDGEFEARRKQYEITYGLDSAQYNEEIITLLSEAMLDNKVKENEGKISKLISAVKGLFSLSVEEGGIELDDGKSVFNFVKEFNKSVKTGVASKNLKAGTKGATGTLVKAKGPSNTNTSKPSLNLNKKTKVLDSKSQLNEDVKNTTSNIINEIKTLDAESQALADKFKKPFARGAKATRLEKEVISNIKPTVDRLTTTLTKRLYDPIADDAKRNVTRQEFQDSLKDDLNTMTINEYKAETNGKKNDLEKFISNRGFLRAQNLAKRLGIKAAEEGIDSDVTSIKDLAADEAVETVAKDIKQIKASSILNPEQTTKAKDLVNEWAENTDLSKQSFKSVPNLIADIIAEVFNVPIKKIINPKANLNKVDSKEAQMAMVKIGNKLKNLLPEGAVLGAANEKLIGTSTGVPKAMLDAFYTKNERLGKKQGLFPYTLNKDITTEDILAAMGILDGKQSLSYNPRSKEAQVLKGMMNLLGKLVTNEFVRTETDANANIKQNIAAGKNIQMFSEALPKGFFSKEKFSDWRTTSNIEIGDETIKELAEQHKNKPMSLLDVGNALMEKFNKFDNIQVGRKFRAEFVKILEKEYPNISNEIAQLKALKDISYAFGQEFKYIAQEIAFNNEWSKIKNIKEGNLSKEKKVETINNFIKRWSRATRNLKLLGVTTNDQLFKKIGEASGLNKKGLNDLRFTTAKKDGLTYIRYNGINLYGFRSTDSIKKAIRKGGGQRAAAVVRVNTDAKLSRETMYEILDEFIDAGDFRGAYAALALAREDMNGLLHKVSKFGKYIALSAEGQLIMEHETDVQSIYEEYVKYINEKGSPAAKNELNSFLDKAYVNLISADLNSILDKNGGPNRYTSVEAKAYINKAIKNKKFYENYLIEDEVLAESIQKFLPKILRTQSATLSESLKIAENYDKALLIANSLDVPDKGISVWDFDDTLAKSKSNVLYTMPRSLSKVTEKEFSNLSKQENVYYHGTSAVINQEFINKEIVKDFPEGATSFSAEMQGLGKHYTKSLENAKSFIDHRNRNDNTGTVGAVSIATSNPKQFKSYQDLLKDIKSTVKNKNLSISERNKTYLDGLKNDGFDSIVYKEGPSYNPGKKSLMAEVVIPFDSSKKLIGSADYNPRNEGMVQGSAVSMEQGKLTAEEFAKKGNQMLEEGVEFDFSEFSKVVDGSKGPFFEKAMARNKKFGNKNVFILTARPANSATAIHEFLKGIGLNIPLSNITGLANSSSEAKANWVVGKAAEGYNDFYFADDHIGNVKAVEQSLAVLDVKSKVQQARSRNSLQLSNEFNKYLEGSTGIESFKKYKSDKARLKGRFKGKFDVFIPPSAEDFLGLLYQTLNKGKLGEAQMKFYEDNLLKPYAKANSALRTARVRSIKEFAAIKKKLKIVPKDLKRSFKFEDENGNMKDSLFTKEQAIRVYIWNSQGIEMPNLSQVDLAVLVNEVNANSELKAFADELLKLNRGMNSKAPSKNWMDGNIGIDLQANLNSVGRKKLLEVWQQNVDAIFSEENLNKLEAAYGPEYVNALESSLRRMRTGRSSVPVTDNEAGNNLITWLNSAVGNIMFFNNRSALLQMLSATNFLNFEDNNIIAAGKALMNIKQYSKDFVMLMNSDYLLDRRDGTRININEADIALIAKQSGIQGVIAKILEAGFLPTKYADSLAIGVGGATFYRTKVNALVKGGMSKAKAEAQAMQEFISVAETSQQSSDQSKISMEQAGSVGKIILAFNNTSSQYSRIIKRSVQDLYNRRGSDKANLAKIVYYGGMQNLLFNFMQQAMFAAMWGGEDDEEVLDGKKAKIVNSMADGLLRGMGVKAAIFVAIKNTAIKLLERSEKDRDQDYRYYAIMGMLAVSPPLSSKASKLSKAASAYEYGKDKMEYGKFSLDSPELTIGANLISFATSLPTDRLLTKAINVSDALDSSNEPWERLFMTMGWPKWTLSTKAEIDEERTIEKAEIKEAKEKEEFDAMTPLEQKTKALEDLKKFQQVDSLKAYGLTDKEIRLLTKEEDRVNKILSLEGQEKKGLAPADAVEEELYDLKKQQQVDSLTKYGLTKKQIRLLKYEEDRVKAIIKLQNKKRKNSLK